MNLSLSFSLKKVIADLLHTKSKSISVVYANIQQQKGGSDCGLFAIATAKALCSGKNPVYCNFDQSAMRPHLIKALQTKTLDNFPNKNRNVKSALLKREDSIEVFCVCQLPDDESVMIECESCQDWFHLNCLKIPNEVLYTPDCWYCSCFFFS